MSILCFLVLAFKVYFRFHIFFFLVNFCIKKWRIFSKQNVLNERIKTKQVILRVLDNFYTIYKGIYVNRVFMLKVLSSGYGFSFDSFWLNNLIWENSQRLLVRLSYRFFFILGVWRNYSSRSEASVRLRRGHCPQDHHHHKVGQLSLLGSCLSRTVSVKWCIPWGWASSPL